MQWVYNGVIKSVICNRMKGFFHLIILEEKKIEYFFFYDWIFYLFCDKFYLGFVNQIIDVEKMIA